MKSCKSNLYAYTNRIDVVIDERKYDFFNKIFIKILSISY